MQDQAPQLWTSASPAAIKRTTTGESKQLLRLILSAWHQVPFYKSHWRGIAAQLPDLRFPEDLNQVPIVQKADLLATPIESLLDRSCNERKLTLEKTSGSSGQPMEILKDPASVRRRSLRFLRSLLICGYRPGQRLLLISSRRAAGLMSYARWHYADLRDQHLQQEYQRVRPHALYGPLSSLLQICDHPDGIPTGFHRPSIVISTAEQMLPAQRAVLEKTFGCPVADFYGMTEVGLVAFRRPLADRFEPASADLLLEFLPLADDPATERLVVTDLTGGAMPMIRYDTGDLVRRRSGLDAGIEEFVGRRIDSLKLPTGSSVSPYRVTMRLEALAGLRQYQVVQRKDLSLDVSFHSETANANAVGKALAAALDEVCAELPRRLHFHASSLPKVAGKFRPVHSEAGAGP